ncbi:competence/damage-inducible protein A [Parabacteroides sp. Marseille-P3160]|uniref:competence/damage-inducible protein A n=1 Tax=Parabacteroides sp. Marseille-P3160 TaxID=1917887 RepID=UPI0009BC57BD|nr:competence/damage-inducible protein A [Parabacteroides sp. Marseille-P3160]
MKVEIITIGDELLIGQVVDTNSAWIGQALGDLGFQVVYRTAIGDVEQDILDAFETALKRVPIVLVTGGIGPTKDDITKKTLCKFFHTELVYSEEANRNMEELFLTNGRKMNELTRTQSYVPKDCTVIQNRAGTAPCTWFERNGKVLVSMPGVPSEMKWLMTNEVLPRLKERYNRDLYIKHQTFWISGYTESLLALTLDNFEATLPPTLRLAYLPQAGIIRLRLSAYCESEALAEQEIETAKEKLHTLLNSHIMVEADKAIEVQIGELLREKQLTLGTAESCTGGAIAKLLTSVPGCSDYFKGSVVSYANEVKAQLLGVSTRDLELHGAVSREVVEQMAKGALHILDCDCSVATSGIAGPGGGTLEKPVGTVWIAVAYRDRIISERYKFGLVRDLNIQRTTNVALLMLYSLIQKDELYKEVHNP